MIYNHVLISLLNTLFIRSIRIVYTTNMKWYQRFFAVLTFIILAGTIVSLMLINLSGVRGNIFATQFYFSTVSLDTTYYWTMYDICAYDSGLFFCTPSKAAYPYSPATTFNPRVVPNAFFTNQKFYYTASQAGYAFFLLSLIFAILNLIPVIQILISGSLKGVFAPIVSGLGLAMVIIAAVLQTVVHIKGCLVWQDAGHEAQLGLNMFICMWVSVLGFILTFIAVMVARYGSKKETPFFSDEDEKASESAPST